MMMKKLLACIAALILLSVPCMGICETDHEIPTIVTIVRAPDQEKAERPPCFPDPTENYIPMPETENYAQGKKVVSGVHADVYVSKNVNDGKTDTYWESKGLPAEMLIELGDTYSISTVGVFLNPASIWEPRQQEIAVWVSTDGIEYMEVAPAFLHQFDPATGNRIRIDIETVEAAFVKVIFTKNTATRTLGAQAAEICVY